MKKAYIIISVFSLVIVTIFIIVQILVNQVVRPSVRSFEEIKMTREILPHYPKELYEELSRNKEEFEIKIDDYNVNGEIFRNGDSKKTVILLHGHGTNRAYSIDYLELFYNEGFNIVMYDHRYSGIGGGSNITMGHYESRDLEEVIKVVKNTIEGNKIIGLHGVSMGGSTALIYAGNYGGVDFVISDCAYSSLKDELSYQLKTRYKVGSFPLINLANFLFKQKAGFTYEDTEVKSIIKNKNMINIPTLIIHGEKDTYTPVYMAQEIYDNLIGEREIKIFENAKHATSYEENVEEYTITVKDFLEKNVK